MPDTQTVLDQLQAALEARPQVQLALAFGSLLTGRADASSDVDLAILCRPALDAEEYAELIREIGGLVGRPVDLVDLETAGVAVRQSIFRHGRRLVCRDRRVLQQAITCLLTDVEDFLPYRQRMLRERRQAWTR